MAATTFTATCAYTTPSGAAATGKVIFTAVNQRETNTDTIQDSMPITANLAGGAISQVLVINVGGYNVQEIINGAAEVDYVIPGIANIDLATVNANLANFDASGVVNVVAGQTVSATTYSFVLADGAEVIKRFTAATAVTATIDGSVAIPVGTVISVVQIGAGQVTLAASNGAVIESTVGATPSTRVQYSPMQLRKDTSTHWVVTGDLQ